MGAAKGKQSGRMQDIQRLIGRALRSVVDLEVLGERQITVDCDVIQADGGTRTASIPGAWVALKLAIEKLKADGAVFEREPLTTPAAAISCGIPESTPLLEYENVEDSAGPTTGDFVPTGDGTPDSGQTKANRPGTRR